ncbi:MAG: 30S ribosomal protein S21 [Deltaproteobacteria bacterium]|nr:30S ribosomal protein S21 [Deltaproteobacteria bacterium]
MLRRRRRQGAQTQNDRPAVLTKILFLAEGVLLLSEVKVYDDQLEKALKILKRKLAQDGTFKEIKKRRFYEKPSVKKKRKRQEAAKRRAKASKKSARRVQE